MTPEIQEIAGSWAVVLGGIIVGTFPTRAAAEAYLAPPGPPAP